MNTTNLIISKDKKCMMFLSMLYLGLLMTSFILSYRFVNIFSILTVSSTFIIPFVYALSDIIAEVYGYHEIRKVIWCSFGVLFIVSLSLFWLTMLPASSKFETFTASYNTVFSHIMRVYFSNTLGMLLGMFLNSYLLIKLKIVMRGKRFFLRSLVSSAVGELLFTAIVYMIVQFQISSWRNIVEMIIVSYSVKMLFTFLSSSITAYTIKPLIYKIEGVDPFLNTKSYNPFKFYEHDYNNKELA